MNRENKSIEASNVASWPLKQCFECCSPSDWYKGGKCDKNGCFEKRIDEAENGPVKTQNQTHVDENEIKNIVKNTKFESIANLFTEMEIKFVVENMNRSSIRIQIVELKNIKNEQIVDFLTNKTFGEIGRTLANIIISKIKQTQIP